MVEAMKQQAEEQKELSEDDENDKPDSPTKTERLSSKIEDLNSQLNSSLEAQQELEL